MYQLVRTDTFDEQLREIILRIADNFGTANALEILDSIEEFLNNLSAFPRMGADPKYPVLKRQGYKVLVLIDSCRDYVRIVLGTNGYKN